MGSLSAPLFGLAPGGVYRAAACCHLRGALLPHLFTLTGTLPRGGLFSVALSVGSRLPGVTWHPAQWSPDFPPGKIPAAARPTPGLTLVAFRSARTPAAGAGSITYAREPVQRVARHARDRSRQRESPVRRELGAQQREHSTSFGLVGRHGDHAPADDDDELAEQRNFPAQRREQLAEGRITDLFVELGQLTRDYGRPIGAESRTRAQPTFPRAGGRPRRRPSCAARRQAPRAAARGGRDAAAKNPRTRSGRSAIRQHSNAATTALGPGIGTTAYPPVCAA